MEGDPHDHDLYKLYESKMFSDFTIVYQGYTFLLHKCFLRTKNEYFENMMDKPWKGLNSVEIPLISDVFNNAVPVEIMNHYFVFVYTRLVESEIMCEHLCDLFCLADYFLDTELESLLVEELANVLNTTTILQYLPLYRNYSNHSLWLKNAFKDFVNNNRKELQNAKDFPFHEFSDETS
jgi:hypothetical protein